MAETASESGSGSGEFSFMQLADPQFGLFARFSGQTPEQIVALQARGLNIKPAPKTHGFADETRLFEAAISRANELRPSFVVVCGDLVNQWNDDAQAEEALRIGTLLDDGIDLHWVPGNHDVGADERHEVPTDESLARYRSKFGPDNYAFQYGNTSFIVLNTSITQHPEEVPAELEAQMGFLETELRAARARQSSHTVLFTHHPLFLEDPEENKPEELHLTIPIERRRPVLELLGEYGVDAVFAGHWHRNNYATGGDLEMIASGSVGYPFGYDPSGYRVVQVNESGLSHHWYAMDETPGSTNTP
jgi:3',5'-cyclic AMP phosphodiesterase CpdA